MSKIVGINGVEIRDEVKVKSFTVSMMVQCPCGTHLLLSFIPGMNLATTCKCKRAISLRGLQLEPDSGQLGTVISIDSSKTLTPTPEELAKLARIQ